MRYDVTNHPLLSDDAKALGSESLEAHGRVAEQVLGLYNFTAFESGTDEYKSAQDAVALQVNYQVEAGIDAFVAASVSRGARSKTFRGGKRMPMIHGMARRIVSRIKPKPVVAEGQ
jgi:hypothetical protein